MTSTAPARAQFFSRTAVVIFVLALSSFPFTYATPLVSGARHFASLHHIHAAAFFSWLGLYVWQTRLAASGRVARHREIGLAVLLVSGAMLPLGWWMALYAARERIAHGHALPFEYSLYNVVDISLFSASMIAAILAVTSRIEWHRRFMYCAALNLLGPAISRWFLPLPEVFPLTDFAPNLLADLFLLVLAVHDRRALGRVHPATTLAAVIMVPTHLIEPFIARSNWWNLLAPALLKID